MSRNTKVFLAIMATLVLLLGATSLVVASTIEVRYARDVNRMVFNDNTGLLDDLRRRAGLQRDSLQHLLTNPSEPPRNRAYIVVSIEDHRLWYRSGDSVLFTTEVATGSGKILEKSGGDTHWRFETPRGRLVVESKETDPVWVAPDWHYVEEAQRRGLGVVRLARRQQLPVGDGSFLLVAGSDVVKRFPDGRQTIVDASEGNELVASGNIVIPPFGTNQRKYHGVLGAHRLNLGDGYALHGTNKPETIGRSVSHGCVRLRNDDIAKLYEVVPIGTPVFIY
jgi:lipoprotein-anchoring transpeptidase ErfK/SrfK